MYRQDEVITTTTHLNSARNNGRGDGWLAKMDMAFCRSGRLTHRTLLDYKHQGPLRIQKALYPEGDKCCHAVLIHPPGGIAAGDVLEVNVKSGVQTHGLITTPSATKWYGSDSNHIANQNVSFELNGALEWLPMESIVFNQARVESDIRVKANAQSCMIGWDQLIFGRKYSGESFSKGSFKQSLRIELDDQLIWHDRLVLKGSDELFSSPIGFRGHYSMASMWALLKDDEMWSEKMLEEIRSTTSRIAWTRIHPRLLVGRLLADPLILKSAVVNAWKILRPLVIGSPGIEPRLWAT